MCGYHQKFTLGAALGLSLSAEEHHKSRLMVSQAVRLCAIVQKDWSIM